MKLEIVEANCWYHGSDQQFEVLREGSTITQWKELAEAFSHKPAMLCFGDDGKIIHNGRRSGYLYRIAEPVEVGKDVLPHPRTTMIPNAEFLTARPLQVVWISDVPLPADEQLASMEWELERLRKERTSR